eukprot:1180866-Prorocentrum_minimum.AAC.4
MRRGVAVAVQAETKLVAKIEDMMWRLQDGRLVEPARVDAAVRLLLVSAVTVIYCMRQIRLPSLVHG